MGARESKRAGKSLLFFVPYFLARLDFLLPPLSAPGSPRMQRRQQKRHFKNEFALFQTFLRLFQFA